jgi:hypothetical protein
MGPDRVTDLDAGRRAVALRGPSHFAPIVGHDFSYSALEYQRVRHPRTARAPIPKKMFPSAIPGFMEIGTPIGSGNNCKELYICRVTLMLTSSPAEEPDRRVSRGGKICIGLPRESRRRLSPRYSWRRSADATIPSTSDKLRPTTDTTSGGYPYSAHQGITLATSTSTPLGHPSTEIAPRPRR